MILLEHDLLGPLGIGRVSFQSYLSSKDIYSTLQVEAFTRSPFGTQLFWFREIFCESSRQRQNFSRHGNQNGRNFGGCYLSRITKQGLFWAQSFPTYFWVPAMQPKDFTQGAEQQYLKWWYGNENCQTVFHWLLHKQFFFVLNWVCPVSNLIHWEEDIESMSLSQWIRLLTGQFEEFMIV